MPEITVNLPNEPYSIVIETGVLSQLGERVSPLAPHARCLLAMDSHVVQPHGEIARQSLEKAGYEVVPATLIAEERHKTLAAAESLYRVMLHARLERRSPVIALGGGIVGDIAGYAAATFLRGVPLIHVPTTLLAMVDASIGGKTGVNFPLHSLGEANDDGLGKNLVGAFCQPRIVIADPLTLQTLERRDLVCGLAECIKHAVVADAALMEWIDRHADDVLHLNMDRLTELITRSASIKAKIVAEDERERGQRAMLNLGHTFAHAMESIREMDVRHGEAVAIGIHAAAHIAVESRRMLAAEQASLLAAIARCGLPARLPHAALIDRLMYAMTFDKKVADGKMRLVLPRGIGAADVVDDVPLELVRQAWLHIGAAE